VVYWSEFLATDPEVRVRFPALLDILTVVDLERGPLSFVSTIVELLGRKRSGSGQKTEITAAGDPPRRLCDTPLSAKVGTNFADKRRSLGRFCLFVCSV
jgi:hypothetical protein